MRKILAAILIASSLIFQLFQPAQAQTPVVRAVLFYSPSCGHCHLIITETLPPLKNQYLDQLQILMVDVTQENGLKLYETAHSTLTIPAKGVPLLVVGERVLLGSRDIPNELSGIIESGLQAGGIDWPALPGLEAFVQDANLFQAESTPTAQPTVASVQTTPTAPSSAPATSVDDDEVSPLERFQRNFAKDVTANTLAVVILLGMVISAVVSLFLVLRGGSSANTPQPSIWIAILCIAGLGIAGYLMYIETTLSEAYCGPVGDCNAVQQSPYARLFGVIPVAAFGLAGYIGILGAWLMQRSRLWAEQRWLPLVSWGMAFFGVLFSSYLTFLEPFIIGASCIWCLSSAVVITLLLWLVTPGAQAALATSDEETV